MVQVHDPTGTPAGTGTNPPNNSSLPECVREPVDRPGIPCCRDLAYKLCGIPPELYYNRTDYAAMAPYMDCVNHAEKDGLIREHTTCSDSPLYLYGTEGQQVKVTVNTNVYNSHPSYTNIYDATLLTDGQMQVNGTLTDSIDYDYNPAIKKITPPAYGRIVPREQLGKVLQEYGEKLDLNKKEIDDLIASGKIR